MNPKPGPRPVRDAGYRVDRMLGNYERPEPNSAGIRHCLACQRRTGSVFAPVAGFPLSCKVSGRSQGWNEALDKLRRKARSL